jgi:hypothetical protein
MAFSLQSAICRKSHVQKKSKEEAYPNASRKSDKFPVASGRSNIATIPHTAQEDAPLEAAIVDTQWCIYNPP